MGLRLRTLAHPFFCFQCYLGFGGEHMRLLLRGCDDKRIFCSFWFLMPIKDQSWWPYLCVSEPMLCSAHVRQAVSVSFSPPIFIPAEVLITACRGSLLSHLCALQLLALYWGLHTIVHSGLVIGWLLIQDANRLEFLADRLNGKGTYILLYFCVSALVS